MRENIRDKGRLLHIMEAIDNIASFTEGVSYDEFCANPMRYFAIVKNIEIIGEAAYMLTREFVETHPEVDWQMIVRMRHVLVHGYYQLERPEIWSTAKNDVPSLKAPVQKMINEME